MLAPINHELNRHNISAKIFDETYREKLCMCCEKKRRQFFFLQQKVGTFNSSLLIRLKEKKTEKFSARMCWNTLKGRYTAHINELFYEGALPRVHYDVSAGLSDLFSEMKKENIEKFFLLFTRIVWFTLMTVLNNKCSKAFAEVAPYVTYTV